MAQEVRIALFFLSEMCTNIFAALMIRHYARLSRKSLNLREISTHTSELTEYRGIRLRNIPKKYANYTALSSLPLEYLNLYPKKRIALLRFLHPSDATSFIASVLPGWIQLGTQPAIAKLEKKLSPKIPAGILCHGLTRSLKVSPPPTETTAMAYLLPPQEDAEEVIKGHQDNERFMVIHFRNLENALDVRCHPLCCSVICY
jgi:hypothetical protein